MAKKKNLDRRDVDAQRRLRTLRKSLRDITERLAGVCSELRETQRIMDGNVKRRKVLKKRGKGK